jgi:hypothetical protein
VDYTLAWLLDDGTLVDFFTGTGLPVFCSVPSGNYFVVVETRGHLPVMTATAVPLNASPVQVDLTSAANVYGGSAGMKQSGGVDLVPAGNVVDRPVSAEPSYAINALDFYYIYVVSTNNPSGVYHPCDLNFDGDVNALDYNLGSVNNDNLYQSYVPR